MSRDTGTLIRLSIIIGALFMSIAFLLSRVAPHPEQPLPLSEKIREVIEETAATAPETVLLGLREALSKLRITQGGDLEVIRTKVIEERIQDPGLRELFTAYATVALNGDRAEESMVFLRTKASEEPPTRFANEMLGDLLRWEGDQPAAIVQYLAEAKFKDAHFARRKITTHYVVSDDREGIKVLLNDPAYHMNDSRHWIEFGVLMKAPALLMRGVILSDYQNIAPIYWFLSISVAFIWFWIIKKICFVRSWKSSAFLAGILGLILGVVSTTLTLFAVIWQERLWGLKANGEFLNDLLFYIVGVGVREEVIKLLCFLPLTPWLYRLRDPRAVLLAASTVGLGFAVQENVNYLSQYGPVTIGRFLTANFLHMGLTAILGFNFCRFLYTPRVEWDRLLGAFVLVVLAHGLYDTDLPQFQGIHSIIILAGIAFYYFDLVEKHCTPFRQTISPLSVFVLGTTTLLGCSIVMASLIAPSFHTALQLTGEQMIGAMPIMFLYINRFRHA
ncbi:MAG: RsiW-degrading membrane proteinase PrsW (M82 family) [Verrucomicrobiales bacterium]|jgi:RsiW-degrading membrane proteinase PrsW (M82 family)